MMESSAAGRRTRNRWGVAVYCVAVFGDGAALAQTAAPSFPAGFVRPEAAPPALPAYLRARAEPLPPLPPAEAAPRPASARFLLRDVRLTGATAVPAAELRAAAARYIGREVDAGDLEDLRRALSEVYLRRGFVNSGVVLPDQTVRDGVVTMQAVEGRLSAVTARGDGRLAPSYVADRLMRGVAAPLSIADLRDSIEILLQDPVIDRLDARLTPGAALGEGVLEVAVTEKPLAQTWLTLSNSRSPAVGSNEARSEAVLRNVAGLGDVSNFRFAKARGLTDLAAATELPLHPAGLRLRLSAESTRSRVVEQPFSILDIQTASTTYDIGLSQPLWRTAAQELTLGVALSRREAITRLLDERFSFSSEADNGASRVTALRVSQTWTERGVERVLAARSTFSFGLDALGSTVKPGGSAAAPDSRFVAWLGQAQVAQRLGDGGTQLLARLDAQFANDPLPSMEQYALGGMASVRGYRENLLVRDNAVAASLELRRPVANLALDDSDAAAPDGAPVGQMQAAVFVDWGRGFNQDRATPAPGLISSVGVGLLWRPVAWAQTQIYYGRALRKIDDGRADSLEDRGVHFRVTFSP